jgi:hypothetical protein
MQTRNNDLLFFLKERFGADLNSLFANLANIGSTNRGYESRIARALLEQIVCLSEFRFQDTVHNYYGKLQPEWPADLVLYSNRFKVPLVIELDGNGHIRSSAKKRPRIQSDAIINTSLARSGILIARISVPIDPLQSYLTKELIAWESGIVSIIVACNQIDGKNSIQLPISTDEVRIVEQLVANSMGLDETDLVEIQCRFTNQTFFVRCLKHNGFVIEVFSEPQTGEELLALALRTTAIAAKLPYKAVYVPISAKTDKHEKNFSEPVTTICSEARSFDSKLLDAIKYRT